MTQLVKYTGLTKLSENEIREFLKAAAIIDVNPDWLGAVIQFESGFNPQAVNPYSGATGLIQFMPSTAAGLQTSIDKLKKMSFTEQLKYVVKYFGEKAKLNSLEDTYLTVFYPRAIGMNLDDIVSRKGEKVYEQNINFDTSRKGYITKRDITSTIRSVYNRGLANGYINVYPLPGSQFCY